MYKRGDLHIHTFFSDGMLSPAEVINSAKKNNVDLIAVTDHDTTSGLEQSAEACLKEGIRFIPGIELSTLYNNESIHILGYFRDDSYSSYDFKKFLIDMKEYRIYRGKKIIENLDKFFKIKIDYDEVSRMAGKIIARPHIARAIIKAGYPYTWDYIFDNFISKDSPAYVPNKDVSVKEGIAILKSVNALVVLAHPVLIKNSPAEELLKFDFDGIEAKYFLNHEEDTEKYMNMASERNLIITAGSDFHGINLNDTRHGSIGAVYLNSEEIEVFINKLKKY